MAFSINGGLKFNLVSDYLLAFVAGIDGMEFLAINFGQYDLFAYAIAWLSELRCLLLQ